MIKIWVKCNHRGAIYLLSVLLKESLILHETKTEFYKINNVPTEPMNPQMPWADIEPISTFKHPVWWFLGGAFTIEDLLELRARDVVWKAENYDRRA